MKNNKDPKYITLNMKRTILTVLLIAIGYILFFLIVIIVNVEFGRISSCVYFKFYGAKIISQEESHDGEHIYSTVRIKRNNIYHELTLHTSFWNFKSFPVYIKQVDSNTIAQILFDSVSEANYQIKHPQNYFPRYCYTWTGIPLEHAGTEKLFPFKIHSIREAFDNIGKIDSAIKSIPLYPGILMVRIDYSQKLFLSRTNIKQSDSVLKKMGTKIGNDILNGKNVRTAD